MKKILFKEESKYLPKFLSLYESVNWSNYFNNPTLLRDAFNHSLWIEASYCNENIIGLIRCVGDGYSIIYIQDLIVHPNWQHQGIGTKLMQHALEKFSHVYQIVLLTDQIPKNIHFYKTLGFETVESIGCCGFMRMNNSSI